MKLEVGMYVRHHHFGIGKIINSYEIDRIWFNVKFNCYGDDDYHCGICEESIGFKASHNIIDLIEYGDYVNGLEVTGFDYKKTTTKQALLCDVRLNGGGVVIKKNDIKSIVTKEQFENISYKVK